MCVDLAPLSIVLLSCVRTKVFQSVKLLPLSRLRSATKTGGYLISTSYVPSKAHASSDERFKAVVRRSPRPRSMATPVAEIEDELQQQSSTSLAIFLLGPINAITAINHVSTTPPRLCRAPSYLVPDHALFRQTQTFVPTWNLHSTVSQRTTVLRRAAATGHE